MGKASRFGVTQLPALIWLKNYDLSSLRADMMAAVIVSIMLIPQSLAYAMLAGLPAETGLYASIFPLLAYASVSYTHLRAHET